MWILRYYEDVVPLHRPKGTPPAMNGTSTFGWEKKPPRLVYKHSLTQAVIFFYEWCNVTHAHSHTCTLSHMHTHTCTHAHAHTHMYTHTCTHTHMHTHAHTHMHTHTCTLTHMYTHTCTHTCTHTHTTHTCTHTCTLSHMHTHTHAHSHRMRRVWQPTRQWSWTTRSEELLCSIVRSRTTSPNCSSHTSPRESSK